MAKREDATPRTLVSGGPVLVLDGSTPAQEAMVIEAGKVVGVGGEDEMRSLAGAGARRLDLDDATAMPGLVDGHSHHLHLEGFPMGLVDILDCRNHDEIRDRIRARADATPPGEWIMTTPVGEPHYFGRRSYRDLAERRLPDRKELDRATSAHPVLIQGWTPSMPNVCAFNSMGLERVGIGSITPSRVSNVTIEKDDQGRPTGIVRGAVNLYYIADPFWLQIMARLPRPTDAQWAAIWDAAAIAGQKNANRLGLTAGYECHAMDLAHIDGWRRLREADGMTYRVHAVLDVANWCLNPMLELTPESLLAQLDLAKSLTQTTDDFLRINGATLGRGGIVESGGFRHYEAYDGPFGDRTRGFTGAPRWVERMVVEYCCKNDVRFNASVYSYVDHDEVLETIESFAGEYDIRSREWVAQHCMVISEAQARRYEALGFHVTQGAGFVWGMGDYFRERIGDEILRDFTPIRRLFDLGLNVSGCVDWGPNSVFAQMELAETHEFCRSKHRNTLPGHAVTREQNLAMFGRNAARLMQWKGIGSLLPGYHADVTIVDRNPMTATSDELGKTEVLRTIVGGRTVYDSGALAGEV